MKRYERLGWQSPDQVGIDIALAGLQRRPAAESIYEIVWNKSGRVFDLSLVAIQYKWMDSFEASVLWGSVLGEWEFLKKLGTFPKPDSHIDSDHGKEGRDLYVALGAFLSEACDADLQASLERASAGTRKHCKLVVALIRAGIVRDMGVSQKGLIELLRHYKKNEFPKNLITKKISFEGTFFVHWAEKQKIPLTVPPEFDDHIVRLR